MGEPLGLTLRPRPAAHDGQATPSSAPRKIVVSLTDTNKKTHPLVQKMGPISAGPIWLLMLGTKKISSHAAAHTAA